jgi:hypothetical protein
MLKYIKMKRRYFKGPIHFYNKRTERSDTVAHACNPSYLRGRDQENHGLRLAQVSIIHHAWLPYYPHPSTLGKYANNWSGIEPVNLLLLNYTSRPRTNTAR